MDREGSFKIGGTVFTLGRKYSPLKVLGQGAYGIVIAAKNKDTGAKVAIKKIFPMSASDVDAKHTLREIRMMRYLGKHENIVSLKDLIIREDADELYVVMDLMDSDLHKIIQSNQPLTDAHFKHFMFQLLRGLHFTHSHGILHRDLKPGNLLVTKDCDLKITDFGLSRRAPDEDAENQAMTEHVVTRWYRPPELMLCADGIYSAAVDVWSVGCILAELLGRGPLFPGKNFMHQLALIFEVIGTPTDEQLAHIRSDQAIRFMKSLPPHEKIPFSDLYPEADPEALDLLDAMLTFHPSDRISVAEALEHPYFDSVRSQYTKPDPVLPASFEFNFEREELSEKALRSLIIEEGRSFRAETEAARRRRTDKMAANARAKREEDVPTSGRSVPRSTSNMSSGRPSRASPRKMSSHRSSSLPRTQSQPDMMTVGGNKSPPTAPTASTAPESTAMATQSVPDMPIPCMESTSPLLPKRIDFDLEQPMTVRRLPAVAAADEALPHPTRHVLPPPSVPRRLVVPVTPPTRSRLPAFDEPASVPRLPPARYPTPTTPTVSPINTAAAPSPDPLPSAVPTFTPVPEPYGGDAPDSKMGGLDDEEVFALDSKGVKQGQPPDVVEDESSDVWEVIHTARLPESESTGSGAPARGRSVSAKQRQPQQSVFSGPREDRSRSRSRSIGRYLSAKPDGEEPSDAALPKQRRQVTVPKSPNFSKMSWERRKSGAGNSSEAPPQEAEAPAAPAAPVPTRSVSKPRGVRVSSAGAVPPTKAIAALPAAPVAPAPVQVQKLNRGSSASNVAMKRIWR